MSQAVKCSASARVSAGARHVHQVGPLRVRVPGPLPRSVIARADKYNSPTTTSTTQYDTNAAAEDASAKLQEQLNSALDFVKTQWERTSDSEKPAAVAIIVGVVVAQIAIGATIDAVDRIPLVKQFLEIVGLAVTAVFAYRYFTDPAERESVKGSIESFVEGVTGKKDGRL